MHTNGVSYERMCSTGSGTYANVPTENKQHVNLSDCASSIFR